MPEGDVVWSTARRLHTALAGRVLARSDFRVPRFATVDLRGRAVHEVVPRGKHLLVRVEGDLTVHTHMMMDGRWWVRPKGPESRDPRVRLVLGNHEWDALGQSLGVVELLATDREETVVGHLGPDPLGPTWDPDEVVRRLAERPAQPIGLALLDQTRLAGVGNVYKAEILFLRGIDPWTPVAAVADLRGLVDLTRRLLDANKARVGHVTTGDTRPGRQHWVYGRAGRPCRRCGSRVNRADQRPEGGPGGGSGERVTFWCPRCQPAVRDRR
jgi:endonuclease VIII